MTKVKLKKSLQVVLENSKQALIKTISESMAQQPAADSEIPWLLLEFTLEYPFSPTLGLAQKHEVDRMDDKHDHPLAAYNNADLELFSENQTIALEFEPYEELFNTADQLLEEIEYEDREPFIFQLYVDVCKALMLESDKWTQLNLAADFHVTARDYEMCDEEKYLKKLLPKKVFNKIQQKLDTYNTKLNDAYLSDGTVIKVKAVMQQVADQYDLLLGRLMPDTYTNVYTPQEIYFLRPYHTEIGMHKRPEQIDHDLSTEKPSIRFYYQYKFSNNIPKLVDYYHDGALIWRKIFQHSAAEITAHKFFLKNGKPEIESYDILKGIESGVMSYEEYMDGHYEETIYDKNSQGQITRGVHLRSMFDLGYKMDATFEYLFEYANMDLYKISCINQNQQKSVSYCMDESFMEEAMEDFIEDISRFTIDKMKEESLENLDAVILEYDKSLCFYFAIYLLRDEKMINISTYELHEDDSAMMNLTVYTTASSTSSNQEYLSREKAKAYIHKTYTQLCNTLSQRITESFQLSVPVVTKYVHDALDL